MVRPREAAALLNVVSVVDPEGTYTVLLAPLFVLTKLEQDETLVDPI